ncbi:hypothetical protein DRW03_05190 [Corallococcus sp. H22C18031201]|nr:hypothetical protein DRW03_05190 [Corallococcus sp. H22C18031201]
MSASEVRLAPLSLAHAPAMLRWMREPSVRWGVGVRSEPSMARTVEWIHRALSPDSGVHAFAILEAGQHVGNVVLDRVDAWLGTARLSIYVGESTHRGRGVGRAAVNLVLRHAFRTLGLFKVWLVVHEENAAARRTYASLGFVEEGRLRGEFLLGERRVDALYMGLLASEMPHVDEEVTT